MKYILIFVVWNIAQGGAPATAEFNTNEACQAAAADLRTKLKNQPSMWLCGCYPKGGGQ